MSNPASIEKDRVMVYLDPELGRLLRLERAETKRPISEIVEKLIRQHYATSKPKVTRTRKPRAALAT